MFRTCVSFTVLVGVVVFAHALSAAEANKERSPKAAATPQVVAPVPSVRAGRTEHGESSPDADREVRLVYRLRNVPATDAAKAINDFLRGELRPNRAQGPASPPGLNVVAEPISNSLLVSGGSRLVEEIQRLVTDLDRTPAMVSIEVVIGEAPAAKAQPVETRKPDPHSPASVGAGPFHVLAKLPPMETIARVRLTTLDNQTAFVQTGQKVPLMGAAPASTTTRKGQQRATADTIGMTLGVTPRISPDGAVVMEIDVQDSQLGPESVGIEATTVQTTVRVLDGQAVVLGSIARRGKADKELFIVLTAHVLEPAKGKQSR